MAKVLIIDSDTAAASAVRTALQAQGIESEITVDGNDGLTLAKSYAPNCIVLCVELQRVSGYSICNKLKKDPSLSTIPLILVSSQATEETFEQHKKLKTRAEGYLRKPFEMPDLLAIMREFVPMKEITQTKVKEPSQPKAKVPQAPAPSKSEEFSLEDLGLEDAPAARSARPAAAAPAAQAAPAKRRPTAESLGLNLDEGGAPAPMDDDATRTGGRVIPTAVHDEPTAGHRAPTAFDLDEDLGGTMEAAEEPARRVAQEEFVDEEPVVPARSPTGGRGAALPRGGTPVVEEPAGLDVDLSAGFEDDAPATRVATRAALPELEDEAPPAPVAPRGRAAPVFEDEEPAAPVAPRGRAVPAFEDEAPAAPVAPRARAAAPAFADEEPPAPVARRPAARPPVVDEEPVAPVAPSRAGTHADPQAETLRNENRQLRQKLQQLEQTLQEKELEFNDRLLQESSRSRESVDLKKKISLLERDAGKYQAAADETRNEVDRLQAQVAQAEEQVRAAEAERDAYADKYAQLVEKAKALQADRQQLDTDLAALREQTDALAQEQDLAIKTKAKAKKAVDIALQLLEETGLSRPM